VNAYIRIGDGSRPTIILDKERGLFVIRGRSFPEDAAVLYDPVINWLKEYAQDPNEKTIFTVKLFYYNSATARKMLEVFDVLEKIKKAGHDVKVQWYYHEEDDVIKENGEDYEMIFGNLDFELISYPERPNN